MLEAVVDYHEIRTPDSDHEDRQQKMQHRQAIAGPASRQVDSRRPVRGVVHRRHPLSMTGASRHESSATHPGLGGAESVSS